MKISVITAVYNSEATVGPAIESVASQTYQDVEHLVIEGKSSDNSLIEIEQARHSRMRVISEPDKGIYDALNKGIRNASGDVVGFMHSDDFFAHERVLARIEEEFKDPAVEAVFGDLDYVAQADPSRVIRDEHFYKDYYSNCLRKEKLSSKELAALRRYVPWPEFDWFGHTPV